MLMVWNDSSLTLGQGRALLSEQKHTHETRGGHDEAMCNNKNCLIPAAQLEKHQNIIFDV
jgi:hypothetical protein